MNPLGVNPNLSPGASAETSVVVAGSGAVSPAGWDAASLVQAVSAGTALPLGILPHPISQQPLHVRAVPAPSPRPAVLAHARLRRSSRITHFTVSAALEALGDDLAAVQSGQRRLGLLVCVMSGCMHYSRRFYDEVCRDPATASPLLFPETVFNAPASHLATVLQHSGLNYTLVGDGSVFLHGLALAGNWLLADELDACLVVGAEENDWILCSAYHQFARKWVLAEGAGALYLQRGAAGSGVRLAGVTDGYTYSAEQPCARAAARMRAELPAGRQKELLCDGLRNLPRLDHPEANAWRDWPGARASPKLVLGDGMVAAAAWQCVLSVKHLEAKRHPAANVSVVGCNAQAAGARFEG